MNKKIIIVIILFSAAIIGLWLLFLSLSPNCLPPNSIINYCNNASGNVKNEGYFCEEKYIVGVVLVKSCPKFYESEQSYFLNDKKVSKSEFFRRIDEVNKDCGNCVVEVSPLVR